jgi:hypothetical protein
LIDSLAGYNFSLLLPLLQRAQELQAKIGLPAKIEYLPPLEPPSASCSACVSRDRRGVHLVLIPLGMALLLFTIHARMRVVRPFRAPWQRHSFRKIAVALRNIRPSVAALLVFFHLFVARRMWKRTAPHPFLSILRCVRCPCCQEQRRNAG